MRIAGKTINIDIGEFTFNCFFNKVKNGEELKFSLEVCKEKLSEKYGL